MLDILDASCSRIDPEVASECFGDAARGEDAPFELVFGHGEEEAEEAEEAEEVEEDDVRREKSGEEEQW